MIPMQPQFDESDLALIEVNCINYSWVDANKRIRELVQEIRIYQDLLDAERAMCEQLRRECDHLMSDEGSW